MLFLACFSNGVLSAQEYSLHKLPQLDLENSHTIKISASEHSEHRYAVNEAKMAYLPNLSVTGQGALLNNPDIRLMGQPSQMQSPKNAAFVMGSLSIPGFNGFQMQNDLPEADLQPLQAEINSRLATADVFLAYCHYLNVTGNLNLLQSMN